MGIRYKSAHFRDRHGSGGKMVKGNTKGAVKAYGSIASFNRWTGEPHENKREKSRRLRQSQSQSA